MYFLTKYLTGGMRLASVVAAIVYMFNPFVVDNMLWGQVSLQAAYALIPLMLLCFIIAVDRRGLDRWTILFSAFTGFFVALISSFQIQYGYIAVVLLALWIIGAFFRVIIKRYRLPTLRGISKSLMVLLIAGSVAILARLNFVIQVFFGSLNVQQIQLQNTNLWYQTAVDASNLIGGLQNTLRMRYHVYSFYQTFENQALNNWYIFTAIFLAITFTFVILVFAAVFLNRRNRSIVWFTLIVIIFAYLSAGTNTPVNIFGWLFQHVSGFYIFREPSKFLVGVCLGSSFLFGITTSRIYKYLAKFHFNVGMPLKGKGFSLRPAKLATVLLLLVILLPNVFPLAQGDFGGLHPTVYSPGYDDCYNWLSSQSGNFRVLILPLSMLGNWSTSASPLYGPGYGGLTFYNSPPQPIVFQPTSVSLDQGSQRLLYYLENLIYTGQTDRLASLLSVLNVKYVVVAPLSLPSPFDIFGQSYNQVLKIIQTTPYFTLVHSSGNGFLIFENLKFGGSTYTVSAPSLAFGNLDLLGDIATEQMSNLPTLVYGYTLNPNSLSLIDSLSNGVIFQGDRFLDYVFQSIDTQYLLTLSSHLSPELNNPMSSWILSTAYTRPISDVYGSGEFYSPSGFVFTEGVNTSLSLQYDNKVGGEQQVWVRSVESPVAGNLQVSIDSNVFSELSLKSQQFQGFQWRLIGNLSIGTGMHSISITSLNGTNLADSLAIIPTSVFNATYTECTNSLENTALTFVIDPSSFTNITGNETLAYEPKTIEYTGSNATSTTVTSLNLTLPVSSNFDLYLDAKATAVATSLNVAIDNSTFRVNISNLTEESNSLIKFGSIKLTEGIHSISIKPGNAFEGNMTFFDLQLVKSSSNSTNTQISQLQPKFDSYTHATIPVNNTQQMFLIYSAAYDSGWELRANNGQLALHLEVNGFSNGWFVSKTNSTNGQQTLDLSFGPQTLLNISSAIDLILFVGVFGAFVVLIMWPIRKKLAKKLTMAKNYYLRVGKRVRKV